MDIDTLKTRLADAEAALHDLNMGKRKVSVSRQGTAITYAGATGSADLERYIRTLKDQIARASGTGGRRMLINQF